jgi:hypothetical protein
MSSFWKHCVIWELQNRSIQFDLSSVPLCSRQQRLAMVLTSQKKKLSDPINSFG